MKKYLLVIYVFFLPVHLALTQENVENSSQNVSLSDMVNMSLDELLNLEMVQSSSLTSSSVKEAPSKVTIITSIDIENSGARRLTDVLEIFVSNFQFLNQLGIPWQMGSRGIMSNDKQLLLVNGRNVLQRTRNGICSELDLPGLSDIKYIEVSHGPGSATHGPGALGMVINIVTFNHTSFDGLKTAVRIGGIENYQSGEIAAAHSFSKDHGLFGYFNISSSQGAKREQAPLYLGRDDPLGEYKVGENLIDRGKYYRMQAEEGAPRIKTHLQYTNKNFEIWARYMDGGERHNNGLYEIEKTKYGHANLNATYKLNTSDIHQLKFVAGFDNFWMNCNYISPDGTTGSLWRSSEQEYNAQVFSQWNFNESLTAIVGVELRYDRLGLPYDGITQVEWTPTLDSIIGAPWNTVAYAATGEIDWKPSDKVKFVIGGRVDKHTYTNYLFSPRASLLYSPNEKNIIKFIFAKSLRLTSGTELRIDSRRGHEGKSAVEELISYEISAGHHHNEKLNFNANVFYHDWKPVGFNNETDYRTYAGHINSWGYALEANYKTGKLRMRAGHSYTKLLSFEKYEGAGRLYHYSTADNGIGNDFTYWHNHNTKISSFYSPNEKLTLTGSLNILWGSPGGYNFALTVIDDTYDPGNSPEHYTLDDNKPFQESVYLNLGAHYKVTDKLKILADIHNVAGMFNENWNKRWIWTVFRDAGNHVIQPPAFSISLVYSTGGALGK
ncbi:TonB-dependent receptor plug domain-containing protein [Labilibacter marinus]|uniref:TonB-dependent receptor plug domain-containing protein n=1 Tax=Labilibacter marinus TaxID=1477105 RepID=UPI00082B1E7B|nr:TonB-dependent receptor plug domain-containing protein [Labilibacter marinus]